MAPKTHLGVFRCWGGAFYSPIKKHYENSSISLCRGLSIHTSVNRGISDFWMNFGIFLNSCPSLVFIHFCSFGNKLFLCCLLLSTHAWNWVTYLVLLGCKTWVQALTITAMLPGIVLKLPNCWFANLTAWSSLLREMARLDTCLWAIQEVYS